MQLKEMLRAAFLPLVVIAVPGLDTHDALAADQTLLLRMPTISREHLAFVYAGDIWVCRRNGQHVRRLTIHHGVESHPAFSPDGSLIAFTGQYDGNIDVYLVPVEGGQPKRLTYHPRGDTVCGWTPDGSSVLFASSRRTSTGKTNQLFTASIDGGLPTPLILPRAFHGSFSPDAGRIAYLPFAPAASRQVAWKRYRGGRTPPIWIFDFATHGIARIPHSGSNDTFPMWIGDTIYFLSDREHTVNIFVFNTMSKQVKQLTFHGTFDIKSASASMDTLVYEQAGRLHLLDLASGTHQPLAIKVTADFPSVRPHWADAADYVRHSRVSPTGKWAVFEARGDIFTVPAETGDIRNLTHTPGIHERSPSWSPDGKWIACFSDAAGEYGLMLYDPLAKDNPVSIGLGATGFYRALVWSPDSKTLAYEDAGGRLYCIDLDTQKPRLLDSDVYGSWPQGFNPTFSPDGRWIAYARKLDNHLRSIFLYDMTERQSHQITDGMSDCSWPAYSRDGQYLYFVAGTATGLNTVNPMLSSVDQPRRSQIYVAILRSEGRSPFEEQSDEEPVAGDVEPGSAKAESNMGAANASKPNVRVDFIGIDERIIALPIPVGSYEKPEPSDDGKLIYLDVARDNASAVVRRFDFEKRESEALVEDVWLFEMSRDGKRLLYRRSDRTWGIVSTTGTPGASADSLNVGEMRIRVDPRAEWRQMFHEAWRLERDMFYARNMHGVDWARMKERYEPFLAHVGHRDPPGRITAPGPTPV